MDRREFLLASMAAVGTTSSSAAVTAPVHRAPAARPRLAARELQELLDDSIRALGIVGAQLAVFDGEQVFQHATGLADRERQRSVDVETLFQIGSTTKLFNAALVMSLVDEGIVDLDAPAKTWLDELRLADDDATSTVTLRQLLSMSSGIDNGPYTDHGRGAGALALYVAELAGIPQVFSPGTAFGYSNAGINVAGLVAQQATGTVWETLLSERILAPLSLTHSATYPEELLFHSVALGYAYEPDSAEPTRVPYWGLPRSMAPAGGTLCCSAGDLVRFARMFLAGGEARSGKRVLSAAAVETMQTPQVTLPNRVLAQKWCAGPYWKQWGNEAILGHSGTNTGGSSMLLWCPARNVAAATISNVPAQGYPLADRVFDTLFPHMFGISKPETPTANTVTPVEVDLQRYVGQFDAWGLRFTFNAEDGQLVARMEGDGDLSSELIPLGEDRFLPANFAMSGNRGWDVAFWGDDGTGRATHYLNGVFALRRTS